MKVIETQKTDPQGLSGVVHTLVRVRVLAEGETTPKGAKELPESDQTPVHDWQIQEDGK